MEDRCFQIKLSCYVWLREDGFMSLQSHPEEQPGQWEKSFILDELLLLFAGSCQYLKYSIWNKTFKTCSRYECVF